MGNLWKAGQIGTKVLGAAGSVFGLAGAVGHMIGDLAFGPGQTREKQLYNWNEPTSFASYQDDPSTRLSTTTIKEDPNLGFKGTLKTVGSLVNTVGSFLPNSLKKETPDAPDNKSGLFGQANGNLAKGNPLNDTPWGGVIKKWAGNNTSENRTKEFNGIWEGAGTALNAIKTEQQPNDILNAYGQSNFNLWNMDEDQF